jgi:pSer/pThr/pTyr-binding forkhead associated (FHA) protein
VIEDLNSTNGIYVQGRRVRRHNLNDGDVVVVGKHELMYVDERLPRTRSNFTETIPGAQPSETGDAGDTGDTGEANG